MGKLKRSALNLPGGAEILTKVFTDKKYKTCLEIGTYRGISAAHISQYVDKVYTVDLEYGRLQECIANGSASAKPTVWDVINVKDKNICQVVIKDNVEKIEIINMLEFDIAFLDGGHDDSTLIDWLLVKRCGTVLFHDYGGKHDKKKDSCPVKRLVDSLPEDEVTIMDCFALWQKK